MDSKLINLTGLWKNKAKDGSMFLSGKIGMATVLVFPNKRKRPDSNDPDYTVCLAPIEPKEQASRQDDDAF
jgi:hypothetical protein